MSVQFTAQQQATAPSGPPVTRAERARHRLETGRAPAGSRRGVVPELLVTVVSALTYAWALWTPSPWRDEAATMTVSRRGVAQILHVTQSVDLVHLAFYLLAHVALTIHDSVTSVRLISVVAMALAAGLVVRLGRRLGDPLLGLVAGALLAASPLASRWAQDARPFALVTLVAVVSTHALLSALDRPRQASRWLGYGLTLVLLCLLNVLALLLVPAHGAYVAVTRRAPLGRWLLTAAVTSVTCVPFLVATFAQRGQVAWIPRPQVYDLTAVYVLALASKAALGVVAAAGAVLAAGVVRHRGLPPGPAWAALGLGTTWAVVPPVLLWGASLLKPLWDLHYVLFALPGITLATAALLRLVAGVLAGRAPERPAGLRRGVHGLRLGLAGAVTVAAVAAVAVTGLPAQREQRRPDGHGEDMQGVAAYLSAQAAPGDAVLFAPYKARVITGTYPGLTRGLADVALAVSPVDGATISGQDVEPDALRTRLAGHPRVWLVRGTYTKNPARTPTDAAKLALPTLGYRLAGQRTFTAYTVELYRTR